jgi:signal transduction histidine kinase
MLEPKGARVMRLADFILQNLGTIISEWEAFAATRLPAAHRMTQLALRDHAEQILRAVAKDLAEPQTGAEQSAKSRGLVPRLDGAPETAAEAHGLLRARSGFDINQMASEYRALRASVLRLWIDAGPPQTSDCDDMVRFNEAIDQALAESVSFYSERMQQARNLFLGMLGHDMRTPLQAIQTTAGYLAELDVGAEVSEAAARLIRSGHRMQALLDDLVQFNRINLGQGLPVHRRPGDLAALVAEEVAQVRAAYPGHRVELAARGQGAGSWDAGCVQRLVRNLVVNAIKYGAQDTPVRVVVDGEGEDVAIEVHNQGAPIDPATLGTLFDPLTRGANHERTDRRDGSLGLGLYIARAVAKAHGGDITARSEGGETVFVARLPRAEQG